MSTLGARSARNHLAAARMAELRLFQGHAGVPFRLKDWTVTHPGLLGGASNGEEERKGSSVRIHGAQFKIPSKDPIGSSEGKDAQAVVLLHGYGAGQGLWFRNVKDLTQGLAEHSPSVDRLYSIDWMGMGLSSRIEPPLPSMPLIWSSFTERSQYTDPDKSSAQLAVEFFLKPLEEWRRLEGLSRIHLVGHSLGGYLAAKYAMWKPDVVASLTLVSPVGIPALPSQGDQQLDSTRRRFVHKLPFPSGVPPAAQEIISSLWEWGLLTPQVAWRGLGSVLFNSLSPTVVAARFRNMFQDDAISKEEKDLCAKLLADYMSHITLASPAGEKTLGNLLTLAEEGSSVKIFACEPLADDLKTISQRTCVMFGETDWMYHPRVPRTVRAMPDGHLVIVPRASHSIPLDSHHAFVEETVRNISQAT